MFISFIEEKELVAEIERAFRNKAESKEVTEMLRGFIQKDNGLATLSTFFAVMLNAAQKSFSHNFAALARFHFSLVICIFSFQSFVCFRPIR